MKVTFKEYISNPMGRSTAVVSNRQLYDQFYRSKLDKIMVRENGKISYKLYRAKHKYYAHLKIPSETVSNFYYDVVIEFSEPDKIIGDGRPTLTNYNVRFFSNDPAFVFNFVHAFNKNDLFITDLKDKMSSTALKTVGKEKNPKDEVGYVKSIYFAYLIMVQRDLFNKLKYTISYNEKIMKADIAHADTKIQQRTEAADIIAKRRKKEKKELHDIYKGNTLRGAREDIAKRAKEIKKTGVSVSSIVTRQVKTVKQTKRTKVIERKK